ncbi:MAG TPA: hypothetical protein VMV25_03735 [Steroidobacteraceae bacterium]|nr:hypothetical protein [Steroidobacteraceae bacterium]
MTDHSVTGSFAIRLPQELLAEAQRIAPQEKADLRIDAWRRSWLSRLFELLVGSD